MTQSPLTRRKRSEQCDFHLSFEIGGRTLLVSAAHPRAAGGASAVGRGQEV